MKKLFKLSLSCLIMCSLFFSFSCGSKNVEPESVPVENEETVIEDITLADFESWAPSFQLIRLVNGFGKVTENTDTKYVKEGKGSAKLQPLGYISNSSQPYLYFPTFSKLFNRDACDFSYVKEIDAWIYSEDENKSVDVGLIVSIASVSSAERIQQQSFKLEKGWNEIRYSVDLNVMNISHDITDIQGVSFAFENMKSRDIADAPVYYLDEVVIKRGQEKVIPQDILELKVGEICDFERLYQEYVISPSVENPICMPLISRVGSENGVVPTSGKKMLKLVTFPGESKEASWPKFTIPEKVIKKAYDHFTEDERITKKIQFDVYNASNEAKIFYPEFYSEGGKNWKAYNVVAVPGRWVTFSLDMEKLKKESFQTPGFIKIAWAEYIGTEQTFYFDNFRIVAK